MGKVKIFGIQSKCPQFRHSAESGNPVAPFWIPALLFFVFQGTESAHGIYIIILPIECNITWIDKNRKDRGVEIYLSGCS
jgi:hypothetical protein